MIDASVPDPVDVELRDGTTVRVRPVRGTDAPGLAAFLEGLSAADRRDRFFGTVDVPSTARALSDTDGRRHHGLVATADTPERIVAHAHYVRDGAAPSAEAAFAVAAPYRRRGLGTLMLAHLALHAHRHGIETFTALVLRANRPMVDLFRSSGFPTTVETVDGEHVVRFPTALTPAAIAACEQHERVAAQALMRRVLAPQSVAVVGASRRPDAVGGRLLRNLIDGGYPGRLYPVNHRADTVQGLRAHRRVTDLPEAPDLVVVAVPAAAVTAVARDCAERGAGALVVLSAGFAEVGAAGSARQRELLDICRAAGMRLVGPNCLGVLSTDPALPLNATFATAMPPAGGVAMLTQSGGLGIALAEAANEIDLGLSAFVSVGNKADISGNDLLNHWADDPRTRVVLLYLESFGNPRRFARIAPRVARETPIIALKAGRSRAGARAAASHTGALVAASDATVDALFAQTGVIRARTIREMFDITRLLASQPVPTGARVAIVTNAGGPAILCADTCADQGLDVVDLPQTVRERLGAHTPPEAALANPVDLLAGAGPDRFRAAVRELARSGAVDALVVIYIRPGSDNRGAEVARAVAEELAACENPLPHALVLMSGADRAAVRADPPPGRPPVYDYPEAAARALGHAVRYGRWRSRPPDRVPAHPDCDPARAAALLARASLGGERWLTPQEVADLFAAYGLPLIETHRVADEAEAARVAGALGRAVVVKAVAPGLVHKSDVGAVHLGLQGAEAVRVAARTMRRRVERAGFAVDGFLVQPQADPGVELLVGVSTDPQFGPVILCGAGGTAAEVLRDVTVRLTPLGTREAAGMLRELRLWPLLEGFRGAPPCDVAAVEDLITRVAALAHAHPQVRELDGNPVSVGEHGAVILDARVRVGPAPAPAPWPSLRAVPPDDPTVVGAPDG